jgi:hypothetical protein
VLQKTSSRVDPHYLDVWQSAHQGNAEVVERLISISFYSYTIFVTFITQYFIGWIYGGVEEDQRARARRLEVSPLQCRYCVCCRRRYPAWKVSECV